MLLSQKVKRKIVITDKCDKYKLADELLNNVRLKKISNSEKEG